VLTDSGQIAFRFAEEIFALGEELDTAIKQRPSLRAIRFHVGVVDSLPKLVAHEVLRPIYSLAQSVHLVCREGKIGDLLGQLAAYRLDLVVADEPASSSVKIRAFNHLLSESDLTFCAPARLAARLRRGFPRSLHQAPALLPTETTGLRRSLEQWFHSMGIRPRVVAEFEDAALMKEMAADGKGFTIVPAIVAAEALARYRLHLIGTTSKCRNRVFAITAERRLQHPAAAIITAGRAVETT
jgi:LysR family transcriptional activator of nhaA